MNRRPASFRARRAGRATMEPELTVLIEDQLHELKEDRAYPMLRVILCRAGDLIVEMRNRIEEQANEAARSDTRWVAALDALDAASAERQRAFEEGKEIAQIELLPQIELLKAAVAAACSERKEAVDGMQALVGGLLEDLQRARNLREMDAKAASDALRTAVRKKLAAANAETAICNDRQ